MPSAVTWLSATPESQTGRSVRMLSWGLSPWLTITISPLASGSRSSKERVIGMLGTVSMAGHALCQFSPATDPTRPQPPTTWLTFIVRKSLIKIGLISSEGNGLRSALLSFLDDEKIAEISGSIGIDHGRAEIGARHHQAARPQMQNAGGEE